MPYLMMLKFQTPNRFPIHRTTKANMKSARTTKEHQKWYTGSILSFIFIKWFGHWYAQINCAILMESSLNCHSKLKPSKWEIVRLQYFFFSIFLFFHSRLILCSFILLFSSLSPSQVQKIDIQFARRAKVIDMKQMKSVCLNTITKQCEKTSTRTFSHTNPRNTEERYKEGAASFGIIYNSLPHLLTKTMAENLSPSVAFYSILHLANEHRLRLYKSTKDNDMNIFLIRQLDEWRLTLLWTDLSHPHATILTHSHPFSFHLTFI